MKSPIVDHWWSKISETDERGLLAARDSLKKLEELENKIAASEGTHAARNVFDNGSIKRALERCIEIHEGEGELDLKDLHIFYSFATKQAEEAQKIIDSELKHLQL